MIIRSKRHRNFTIIPNSLARNHTLSMKDKGLLVDMLSYPDNWHFHLGTLAKQYKNTSSESSVRRVLRNLKKYGYIAKGPMHRRKGKFRGRDMIVYDHPVGVRIVHNEQKSPQNRGKIVHNEQSRQKTAVQVRTPVTVVHNEHGPLFKYEQRSKSSSADSHMGSSAKSHRCSSTNTYKDCNTVNKKDYKKINKKRKLKNGKSQNSASNVSSLNRKSTFKGSSRNNEHIRDPFMPQYSSSNHTADKAAGFTPLNTAHSNSSLKQQDNEIQQLFTKYKNYFQDSTEDRDLKVKEIIQDCYALPELKSITFNDLKHEINSLINFDEYGHRVTYPAVFIKRGIENILRRKRNKQRHIKQAEINRDKRDKAYDRYADEPTDKEIALRQRDHYRSPAGHPDKDSIEFLKNQHAYHANREKELNKKL